MKNEAENEETGSNEPEFNSELLDGELEEPAAPAEVTADPAEEDTILDEDIGATQIIDSVVSDDEATQILGSAASANEATQILASSHPIADAQLEEGLMDGLDVLANGQTASVVPVLDTIAPGEDPEADEDDEDMPRHHYLRNTLITLFVILVLAAGSICGWLYYDDSQNASCHVPGGVTLAGVDVHGYSQSELISLVNKKVTGGMGTTTLEVAGQSYDFSMAQYATFDVSGTVEAVMATIEPDVVTRCIERAKEVIGIAAPAQERDFDILYKVNKKKMKIRVQAIADQVDTDAQDASYGFDTQKRKVVWSKSKTGYELKVKETVKALVDAAQKGEEKVEAVAEVTQPKTAELGQAIFVDLNECHLYFYVNGKVKKDYPCTPGKSGYETPSGTWSLEYKDSAPTWYNPHSDWSKNMPETIAPGESNPLGLRALALSCGGGIYIHGTTNTGELGTHASHGCIRLANANVVELFDLVETGIPIFVY